MLSIQTFVCVITYVSMLYANYINRNCYIKSFEYNNSVSPFPFMTSLLKKIIFPIFGLLVVDRTLSELQTFCTILILSLFGAWTFLLPEKTSKMVDFYLLCEISIFTVISLFSLIAWLDSASVLQTLVYGFVSSWSTMMMLMFTITLIRDGYKITQSDDNIVPVFFIVGIVISFMYMRWHNGWTIALPLIFFLLKSWKSYNIPPIPLLDWDVDRMWAVMAV